MENKTAEKIAWQCFPIKSKVTCKNLAHLEAKKNQPKKSLRLVMRSPLHLFTADERRPSTGSSLYHKVYSSSSSSSSSESGSEGSESEDDDDQEESEEGSDEESESDSDETESESEEEEEEAPNENKVDAVLTVGVDVEQQIMQDQEMTSDIAKEEQGEIVYYKGSI